MQLPFVNAYEIVPRGKGSRMKHVGMTSKAREGRRRRPIGNLLLGRIAAKESMDGTKKGRKLYLMQQLQTRGVLK